MAKIFEFKVYNDNMLLVNSFDVKEEECNRLIDKIQRTYFTPSGPFEGPYEEIAVNKTDGQTGYFNLTPWSIVKYNEKGIIPIEANTVTAKTDLESNN